MADTPTNLVVSNQLPTSLTISWDDAGDDVQTYHLYRWTGTTATGTSVMTSSTGTTQNITGLSPGKNYTFEVNAFFSDPGGSPAFGTTPNSDPLTVQMLTGCMIRVGDIWQVAVPYVRVGGVWKMALPHVRVAGVWQSTE